MRRRRREIEPERANRRGTTTASEEGRGSWGCADGAQRERKRIRVYIYIQCVCVLYSCSGRDLFRIGGGGRLFNFTVRLANSMLFTINIYICVVCVCMYKYNVYYECAFVCVCVWLVIQFAEQTYAMAAAMMSRGTCTGDIPRLRSVLFFSPPPPLLPTVCLVNTARRAGTIDGRTRGASAKNSPYRNSMHRGQLYNSLVN